MMKMKVISSSALMLLFVSIFVFVDVSRGITIRAEEDVRKITTEQNALQDSPSAFLNTIFKGPVESQVRTIREGVILTRQPALDMRIIDAMYHSLGPLHQMNLITVDDRTTFELEIDDPTHPHYRPFFFNRESEYGNGHAYYEALTHCAFIESQDPHERIIKAASARYSDRGGQAVRTHVVPATAQINAFVDALRDVNAEFLESLTSALLAKAAADHPKSTFTSGLIHRFVGGIWRDCAIQYHFRARSRSTWDSLHLDHINSALHMAVTLNGARTVAFVASRLLPNDLLELEMETGDVYLTAPRAVMHGISVKRTGSDSQRSVALQLRTLLSVEDANALHRKVGDEYMLIDTIFDQLDRFSGRLRAPTWSEFEHHLQHRLEHLQQVDEDDDDNKRPDKVIFQNIFEMGSHHMNVPNNYQHDVVAEGAPHDNIYS